MRERISDLKRLEILRRDNYTCQRCKLRIPADQKIVIIDQRMRYLEIDHIIPLSLEGNSEKENLQVLCNICNCSKGASSKRESNKNRVLKSTRDYLLALREYGLTQYAIAKELDVCWQTVHSWCVQRTFPCEGNFERIKAMWENVSKQDS